MPQQKLPNYLRAARRRQSLTQAEVAFLTGCGRAEQISRYERYHRLPQSRTLFAFHLLFRLPTTELFGGECAEMERQVRQRALELARELSAQNQTPVIARKVAFLEEIGQGSQSSTPE